MLNLTQLNYLLLLLIINLRLHWICLYIIYHLYLAFKMVFTFDVFLHLWLY